MECPYCNYKDGWDADEIKEIQGESGSFYKLSNDIEMERDRTSWTKDTTYVFGCPSCMKIFMSNGPY